MKVLGCLGFYSCYIKNLHVDSQPFYELIKDTTPFTWTDQHEELFKEINSRISEDTTLAVPSTKYLFHIRVDSSNVGAGCILVQQFPAGKRIVSFNSRVFDNAEQEMSTLHQELCGIVSALKRMNIISSDHPYQSISTVITNPYSVFGEEKDSYLIDFSNIKLSSPSSTTSRSSGHPDPTLPSLTSLAGT